MRAAKVIKDNLFEIPPLFQFIQEETESDLKEMYKVFNMGHRLEIYVDEEEKANEIVEISKSFDVDAKIIGRVEEAQQKEVEIHASDDNAFSYK
jgi:phosphoribosylformylglycinamidine cyclo-ligase